MHEKWSAMILTGGQSTRFGSDKSQALLGGQTLLSRILSDLPEKTEVIIVGPKFEHPSHNLRFVQENPVGGGPVAAVKAGIDLIDTEFVALIATDMPFAVEVITNLSNSLNSATDGVIPLDGEGVPQMLCALYRKSALGNALSELGDPHGRSMRSLLALLQLTEVELPPNLKSSLLDIDTPAELQRAAATKRSNERVDAMNEWIEEVKKELGLTLNLDIESILDTARDAAHTVERKAAPVTTFLLGYAIAAGADAEVATKKLAELAKNWPTDK